MKAVQPERYTVDQIYIGCFEVMDSEHGLIVAKCPYYFDGFESVSDVAAEARGRAEAIADALNFCLFDWKPPPV